MASASWGLDRPLGHSLGLNKPNLGLNRPNDLGLNRTNNRGVGMPNDIGLNGPNDLGFNRPIGNELGLNRVWPDDLDWSQQAR